jgi:hypothetical protein
MRRIGRRERPGVPHGAYDESVRTVGDGRPPFDAERVVMGDDACVSIRAPRR